MKKIAAFALLSIFALSGCGDSSITSTNGGSGTSMGYAHLFDVFGNQLANNSGIKITLEGTNYSGYTDSSGIWAVTAPSGSYYALVSKDGYVTKRLFNVEVPTHGVMWHLPPTYPIYNNNGNLKPIPDYLTAKNLVLRPFEDETLIQYRDTEYYDSLGNYHKNNLYDTTHTPSEIAMFSVRTSMSNVSSATYNFLQYDCHVFCAKNSDIDPVNKRNELVDFKGGYNNYVIIGRDTVASIGVHRSALLKAGFHSGDHVYCAGFSTNYSLLQYYYDPSIEDYITPLSKNHTEVKSFILP